MYTPRQGFDVVNVTVTSVQRDQDRAMRSSRNLNSLSQIEFNSYHEISIHVQFLEYNVLTCNRLAVFYSPIYLPKSRNKHFS